MNRQARQKLRWQKKNAKANNSRIAAHPDPESLQRWLQTYLEARSDELAMMFRGSPEVEYCGPLAGK